MIKKHWKLFGYPFLLLLFLPLVTIGQNEKECLLHEVNHEDKSLWGIGQMYSVNVEEIQAANELKTVTIKVGHLLKIPVGKFMMYRVKSTDKSLWQISQYYQIELDTIFAYNDIKKEGIKVGDIIRLRTSALKNRSTIAQSEKVFLYGKENYKLTLDVQRYWGIGEKWEEHSANIYLYKKKGKDWILLDRMYHLHVAYEDYIHLGDLDQNGIPDVEALKSVGARSYSYWNLVVIDFKKSKLKLVKKYDELSSPTYDEKEKGIRGEYFSAKENMVVKSKNVYIIDYDNYRIKKIRSLGKNL